MALAIRASDRGESRMFASDEARGGDARAIFLRIGARGRDQGGVQAEAEIVVAGEIDQQATVAKNAAMRRNRGGFQLAQAVLGGAAGAIGAVNFGFCHLPTT